MEQGQRPMEVTGVLPVLGRAARHQTEIGTLEACPGPIQRHEPPGRNDVGGIHQPG